MLSSWVSNGSLDQCTTAITVVQSEWLQSFPISQTLITDFFTQHHFCPTENVISLKTSQKYYIWATDGTLCALPYKLTEKLSRDSVIIIAYGLTIDPCKGNVSRPNIHSTLCMQISLVLFPVSLVGHAPSILWRHWGEEEAHYDHTS